MTTEEEYAEFIKDFFENREDLFAMQPNTPVKKRMVEITPVSYILFPGLERQLHKLCLDWDEFIEAQQRKAYDMNEDDGFTTRILIAMYAEAMLLANLEVLYNILGTDIDYERYGRVLKKRAKYGIEGELGGHVGGIDTVAIKAQAKQKFPDIPAETVDEMIDAAFGRQSANKSSE